MERRTLSEPSLRDLEECEARVQALMLASRPGESTAAPAETKQDLRTSVGDGLFVKPLGHTPPLLDEHYGSEVYRGR